MRLCLTLMIGSLAAAPAHAQFGRPDWHTGDYPGRDQAMWAAISEDLKTSFPRGGAPVKIGPFWQDAAVIHSLKGSGIGRPSGFLPEPGGGIVVAGENGNYLFEDGKWTRPDREFEPEKSPEIDGWGMSASEGVLWQYAPGTEGERVYDYGKNGPPDSDARDVAIGPDKKFYVATASGIGVKAPDGKWSHITGRNGGLPINDATSISFAADGTMWVGTKFGAARRNTKGEWNYRAGPRWMIGDEVIDIRALENGGALILTADSLTELRPRRMTLRDKAKHYDAIIQERHVRHGAVTGCSFRKPGDFSSWVMGDNDNDGLWTSIYVGAKCFEYGATKDPEAKRLAKKHFDFLERLETINGVEGYISRSIRPLKFEPDSHESYNFDPRHGEWHESKVEPGWQWKSDTSSDEITGHYFAYGVYYDYVAKGDPAEEKRVQALVRRVTNFIIDNDFCFVDLDGHPTRWAIYSPRLLSGDLLWSDQIAFNALGILAHLKVAMHICGDQKFKDAYRMLIDKHGYAVKAMHAKEMLPNTPGAGINHSDDEMAWLEYYHLLLYPDDDPRLRWQYKYSAARSMRPEIPERSPFFNFPFALEFPKWAHVADGVDTLVRWPLDLRGWRVENSRRDDVIVDERHSRHHRKTLITPVPIDEREPQKWNHDPYVADEGDPQGRHEDDGAAWLLPYWMGVYHKLIVEEKG